MKICFNIFPPANKLIAILVCALLLLSYSRIRANGKPGEKDLVFTQVNIK